MAEHAHDLIPHLVVEDGPAAIDFYVKALGATETMRVPAEDGKRLLHAEIAINGRKLYLRDDFPDHSKDHDGGRVSTPQALGGTAVTLHLDVADCDQAVERAASHGARVIMAPHDAFWGARYAQIIDPFGHSWSFAHPLASA